MAVARAERVGAERRGLDIVLDPHRNTELRFQGRAEIELVDTEVHRVRHERGTRLDLTGDAHADGGDLPRRDPGVAAERGDGAKHRGDHGIRSPARGEAHAPHDLAGGRHGDRVGLGAPDIQAHPHEPTSRWESAAACAPISP